MSLDVYLYAEPPDSDVIEQETLLFHKDITHNLGKMATAAGLYMALWRPEEIGVRMAYQLIPFLRVGLSVLKEDKPRFEEYNSLNGWGNYDNLVSFTEEYMAACIQRPNAYVRAGR